MSPLVQKKRGVWATTWSPSQCEGRLPYPMREKPKFLRPPWAARLGTRSACFLALGGGWVRRLVASKSRFPGQPGPAGRQGRPGKPHENNRPEQAGADRPQPPNDTDQGRGRSVWGTTGDAFPGPRPCFRRTPPPSPGPTTARHGALVLGTLPLTARAVRVRSRPEAALSANMEKTVASRRFQPSSSEGRGLRALKGDHARRPAVLQGRPSQGRPRQRSSAARPRERGARAGARSGALRRPTTLVLDPPRGASRRPRRSCKQIRDDLAPASRDWSRWCGTGRRRQTGSDTVQPPPASFMGRARRPESARFAFDLGPDPGRGTAAMRSTCQTQKNRPAAEAAGLGSAPGLPRS